MGVLHDKLEENGYEGHELKVMLIRLLFCLFAEDTGIFEKYQFQNLIPSAHERRWFGFSWLDWAVVRDIKTVRLKSG